MCQANGERGRKGPISRQKIAPAVAAIKKRTDVYISVTESEVPLKVEHRASILDGLFLQVHKATCVERTISSSPSPGLQGARKGLQESNGKN